MAARGSRPFWEGALGRGWARSALEKESHARSAGQRQADCPCEGLKGGEPEGGRRQRGRRLHMAEHWRLCVSIYENTTCTITNTIEY